MAKRPQATEIKRRIPRQARATETVEAILEAATQILEAGGLAAFTTNAVAERAGVSIGTLYQYFTDKNELLRAIAQRELRTTLANVARVLADDSGTPEQRVRGVVRAIVNAFHGRLRARRAVVQAVISQTGGQAFYAPVAAFIAANRLAIIEPHQTFVLSRAFLGAIRAAVLEDPSLLKSRSFEDEIVRLILAYLGALNVLPASTAPG
jgi:AcrR family transcriptional regulator